MRIVKPPRRKAKASQRRAADDARVLIDLEAVRKIYLESPNEDVAREQLVTLLRAAPLVHDPGDSSH